MYCYIYDDYLQSNRRYEKELMAIENRLTDLGIAGKIARLALFRDAEEMLRDEINRGVTTVVVVGNDETVHKVINVIIDRSVICGLIPIGPKNTLAKLLGVPEGVAACDVLSARRVETIDIGSINGQRFITGVTVPNVRAELTCDERYRIVPTAKADLQVCNLTSDANPRDGLLQAVVHASVKHGWGWFSRRTETESILPFRSLAIRSEKPIALFADGSQMSGTHFDISIEPMMLKVITGKERMFG